MPTILINTNLLNSNSAPDQSDLKDDISSIINKLLSKSESMDSFMIKYDLNDLTQKQQKVEQNSDESTTTTTKTASISDCICGRLANMFTNLLNKTEPVEQQQDNKMDSINNELKLLRKYQTDLAQKFNLILNKLDNKTPINNINNINQAPIVTKNVLTGAKKRKFNAITTTKSIIKNENIISDSEETKAESKSTSSNSSSSGSSSTSSVNNKHEQVDEHIDHIEEYDQQQQELDQLNNNDEEVNEDEEEDIVNDDLEEEDVDLLNNDEMNDQDINELDDVDQLELEAAIETTNQSDELNYYKNLNKNKNSMLKPGSNNNFNKFNNNQGQIQAQQRNLINNRISINQNRPLTQQQARIPPNYNTLAQQSQFMHGNQTHNRSLNYSNQRSIQPNNNRFNFNTNNNNHQQINRTPYDHQYKSIALTPLPSVSHPKTENYDTKPSISQPTASPNSEIDLNELFKGEGPKFLQLELYKNFKPPIFIDPMSQRSFIDDNLASSAYSKSKSRRNFAAHLAKLVFTPRERLECNCNGRFGKKALDTQRLIAIRNTLFKYYPCKQSTLYLNGDTITSGDHDENNVWIRQCLPAIDESNRVLKKQLIAWYKKNKQMDSKTGSMSNSFNQNNTYSGFDNQMANCLVDDDEQLEDDFELNI